MSTSDNATGSTIVSEFMMPPSNFSNMVSPRLSHWLNFCSHLTLTYPLLFLGALYGQWLLSWAILGHPPQPSINDPKFINGASWMHYLTGFALIGFMPMACSGLVFNTLYIFKRRLRARKTLQRILLFLTAWFGTFLLLRLDPGSVLSWWLD